MNKKNFLLLMLTAILIVGVGIKFYSLGYTSFIYLPSHTPDISSTQFEKPNDTLSRLVAAQLFFTRTFVQNNSRINLYVIGNSTPPIIIDNNTNSEAMSYYLLWTANAHLKGAFDSALDFVNNNMTHPKGGYMMWRLNEYDIAIGDGENIASDADLRAIVALSIADQQWHDPRYAITINRLATGMEKVAITKDQYLAPYGGYSGDTPWAGDTVWLSYADFRGLKYLAAIRNDPWEQVYTNMKEAVLRAQLPNGLYYSEFTANRTYTNSIDNFRFSINSLWIMVHAAESGDAELEASARKSLDFYKRAYARDAYISEAYDVDGIALVKTTTPWTYAIVGRASKSLGDEAFAEAMSEELKKHMDMNVSSPLYGSIPDGGTNRIGQFTMQESILTMQRMTR